MYQFCDLKTIILCFVNLKLELRETRGEIFRGSAPVPVPIIPTVWLETTMTTMIMTMRTQKKLCSRLPVCCFKSPQRYSTM